MTKRKNGSWVRPKNQTIHVYIPHGSPTINTLCNWISYTRVRVETDSVKVAMEALRPTSVLPSFQMKAH